ncbi:unnamed protein product, partial [Clonostachys rosea]
GLGLEISKLLVKKGIKVFLTDCNESALRAEADGLQMPYSFVDVASWESQHAAFKQAVKAFGRIDYLYPIAGIGENTWIPPPPPGFPADDFVEPNLSIIDINVKGFLYTVSLAVQQFRKQPKGYHGFRGKILSPSSIMGIYPSANNPMYNASKHAITGFTRSFGRQLPREDITMNAFCPSSIKTDFSKESYYNKLEEEDLFTKIDGVFEVVEKFLGADGTSGECYEIGPSYHKGLGLVKPKFPDYSDEGIRRVFELIDIRGNAK